MSFYLMNWDISIFSFKNFKLSSRNYPSLQALEVHKYDYIGNALKIKDGKRLQENQDDNFSESRMLIYLKPCCKFEFVCFLETYLRKFINLDYGGTQEDPFSPSVPKISLTGSI